MKREIIVRWLLSTLLGSFIIAILVSPPKIIPIKFFDVTTLGFQGIYTLAVASHTIASLIAYLLVTPPKWLRKAQKIKVPYEVS